MKRVGIGGFQNFDANLFTPQVVQKKLVYMTPEWKDAFKFTTNLADKLGLEMAIAASPGWSETGGPWVPAKDGMKKYVWSETRIKGGQTFSGKLPQPPDVSGAFQNVPFAEGFALGPVEKKPNFYQDSVVIAYRQPNSDIPFRDLNPKITSSGGNFDLNGLTDGDVAKTSELPPTAVGEKAWIQFEFDKLQTFKSLSIVAGDPAPQFFAVESNRYLEASEDGKNFRVIAPIPTTQVPQNTLTFAPVTAKYFRVTFKTLAPRPNPFFLLAGIPIGELKPKGTNVAEIVLNYANKEIKKMKVKSQKGKIKEEREATIEDAISIAAIAHRRMSASF